MKKTHIKWPAEIQSFATNEQKDTVPNMFLSKSRGGSPLGGLKKTLLPMGTSPRGEAGLEKLNGWQPPPTTPPPWPGPETKVNLEGQLWGGPTLQVNCGGQAPGRYWGFGHLANLWWESGIGRDRGGATTKRGYTSLLTESLLVDEESWHWGLPQCPPYVNKRSVNGKENVPKHQVKKNHNYKSKYSLEEKV